MKFFENTKRLAKEVLSLKKYKMMALPLAIITGIFMLPLGVAFFVYLGLLFIFDIFYGLVEAPIRFLHKFIKDEAKEMSRVTEVVIYIISWPTIFILYFFYAFWSLFIHFFYFLTQLLGYIVSLCGFKFHISILEEDIAIEDSGHRYNIQAIIFIAVNATLLITLIVLGIVTFVNLYNNYQEAEFWAEFAGIIAGISSVMELFTIIYVPIAFMNKPRKEEAPVEEIPEKVEETKEEEKPEEPAPEEPKEE